MENKPSVEGMEHRKRLKILELHLGSEYYRTGEFHNNISNAMQEYASLLVNKTALDYLLELEKQRDHYKALAEAAHEIINLPLGIKGKVDIDEDMGKEVKSALKKYNELKNEQRIVGGL